MNPKWCLDRGKPIDLDENLKWVSERVSDKIALSQYVIHCTCVQYGWHKKWAFLFNNLAKLGYDNEISKLDSSGSLWSNFETKINFLINSYHFFHFLLNDETSWYQLFIILQFVHIYLSVFSFTTIRIYIYFARNHFFLCKPTSISFVRCGCVCCVAFYTEIIYNEIVFKLRFQLNLLN